MIRILAILFVMFVSACSDSGAQDSQSYDSYVSALDRSCVSDSDCAVKDVGNCCGYYPACVNINARTEPDRVKAECAKSGMAGICGFPSIESCRCAGGSCEPVQPAGAGGRVSQ